MALGRGCCWRTQQSGRVPETAKPTELVTARRYSEAGRIPLEPRRPRIWKIREKKAEK